MELWKTIPGYSGYEVSDAGRVRSVNRKVTCRDGKQISKPGILLRPGIASHGYPTVSLKGETHCVHILVLLVFVGPRPKEKVSRHKNGIKTDVRLLNLHYGTPTENNEDRARHQTNNKNKKGYRFAEKDIIEIRSGQVVPDRYWAEKFGCSVTAINNIRRLVTYRQFLRGVRPPLRTGVNASTYKAQK